MPPKKTIDDERLVAAMKALRDETVTSDAAYEALTGHSDFCTELKELVAGMPGMPLSPFVQLATSGVAAVAKKTTLKMALGSDYYSRGNNPYSLVIARCDYSFLLSAPPCLHCPLPAAPFAVRQA